MSCTLMMPCTGLTTGRAEAEADEEPTALRHSAAYAVEVGSLRDDACKVPAVQRGYKGGTKAVKGRGMPQHEDRQSWSDAAARRVRRSSR